MAPEPTRPRRFPNLYPGGVARSCLARAGVPGCQANLDCQEPPPPASRSVALLVDRSESMSIQDQDRSRYEQALSSRPRGCSRRSSLRISRFRLSSSTRRPSPRTGQTCRRKSARQKNQSRRGDCSGVRSASPPAIGGRGPHRWLANETADNARALTSLVDARVPFIGVGFGNDQGVQTLSLREVEAPAVTASRTPSTFRLSSR